MISLVWQIVQIQKYSQFNKTKAKCEWEFYCTEAINFAKMICIYYVKSIDPLHKSTNNMQIHSSPRFGSVKQKNRLIMSLFICTKVRRRVYLHMISRIMQRVYTFKQDIITRRLEHTAHVIWLLQTNSAHWNIHYMSILRLL